ncbi:MAG: Fic family protein [Janthinobacterium lividum]
MNIETQSASLHITPEALRLISDLDQFKGAWRAFRALAPERLAALRRIATIESVGSSTRIEGARLSDREVEILLSGLDTHSFRSRDEEEVAGYAEAMETVFTGWEAIPLTENHIKQLHQILLQHSSKDVRHRGDYKHLPNHVEAFDPEGKSLGVVFATTSPLETPWRMQELVGWIREALSGETWHPLLVIAVFTVYFLAIHPFQDGNGRLSRVLTTLLLLRAGYSYVPYSSLESVIEAGKEEYYLALRRTQGTLSQDAPDWEPWLLFFLRALQCQKSRLEEKVNREQAWGTALPALSVQILELAREHGRVTTAQIETLTGESRSTIKARLNALMQAGKITRHGQGRSTWYALS